MKKLTVRIMALIIALILIFGMFTGILPVLMRLGIPANPLEFTAFAAPGNIEGAVLSPSVTSGRGSSGLTLTFRFSDTNTGLDGRNYDEDDITIVSGPFETVSNSQFSITRRADGTYRGSLARLSYTGASGTAISFDVAGVGRFDVTIPSAYFTTGSGNGGDYESDFNIDAWADARLSENVTRGKVDTSVSVTFHYTGYPEIESGSPYDIYSDIQIISGPFGTTADTTLRVTERDGGDYYQATLSRLVYTGGDGNTLVFELDGDYRFTVDIPTGYFKPGESEDASDPKPSIVIDTVTVKNSQGQVLTEIDEDTPAFTVEIIYADLGLADEPRPALERAKNYVFMTNSPGLRALNGTTGKIELGATSGDYPRYRVTFNNIKADGTGSAFNFFVQYELEDYDNPARSETVVAELPVDKDATEGAILRPNVIISQYSYGENPIIAGDVFNLEFRFENTSTATTVENMVATIEPADGFVITSASNTVFFPTMAPGENKPFTLSLQAREAVSDNNGVQTTQYSITVKFEYQYLDNKAYKDDTSEVKIAIPVTQLDRFAVDEITDYTSYMQAGEEGYISVPITNKGKPTIGNISGFVEAITPGVEFVSPITRFGPLEGGGQSDTVDINITIMTPGEFSGNAVIEYEDGNMNQKRVSVPFVIMVEEPYVPSPEEMTPGGMEGMEEPEGGSVSLFSILMCAFGGILIAVPLALYMIKRLKLKGSEDFDEAF